MNDDELIAKFGGKINGTPQDDPLIAKFGGKVKANSGFIANAVGGIAEPVMSLASGMIAKPVSDVVGLGATLLDALGMGDGSGDMGVNAKRQTQDALTYSPRTDAGKAITESPYNPINAVGNLIEKGSSAAGNLVRGNNPGPLRDALGNAVQEAIPQAISVGGAKIASNLAKRAALASDPEILGAKASLQTDSAIAQALREMDQSAADIPEQQMQALRDKVSTAFQTGKQIDPAALLREEDFKSLGMKPTLGMVTRDPMQFAREQNLRGIEGVGDPLSARFQELGNQLQQRLAKPAEGALDRYPAGNSIMESLSGLDNQMKGVVNDAYNAARGSDGRYANLDVSTFSSLANNALDDGMLGHYVPNQIRSMLNDISQGKIPFNVNTQVQFDSVLSAAQRSAGFGSPEALAVGKIKDALKQTPLIGADASTEIAAGGPGTALTKPAANVGPVSSDIIGDAIRVPAGADSQALFAAAKAKALERFKMHDEAPGLKAAAEGTVAPDDFVRKFIVNGKTEDVQALSGILKQSDPAAWDQARAQIGDTLRRAAFGENAAGDSPFATSRYMAAVRQLGVEKISAFFNAAEVDDFLKLGRVGTYIKQAPNGAAVNSSNTAAALANLAQHVPGNSILRSLAGGAYNSVTRNVRVKNALNGVAPYESLPGNGNYLKYLMAADQAGIGEGQYASDRRR